MRFIVVAVAIFAALLVLGCGTSGSNSNAPDDNEVPKELEEVVSVFGKAYISGDMDTVLAHLPPDAAGDVPAEYQEAFRASTANSSVVTIDNFSYSIQMHGDSDAVATYGGLRCEELDSAAPTSAGSSPTEFQEGGQSEGQDCLDIASQSAELSGFRFERVDGTWFGTLPELR